MFSYIENLPVKGASESEVKTVKGCSKLCRVKGLTPRAFLEQSRRLIDSLASESKM